MIYNKRIIAAIIAAIALISVCAASFAVNAVENQKIGDVDGNGEIDINDATTIQKVLAKLTENPENYDTVADVNSDGIVNVRDVTVIQKYLAKYYNELPYTEGETEPVTTAPVTQPETDEEGWVHKIYQP